MFDTLSGASAVSVPGFLFAVGAETQARFSADAASGSWRFVARVFGAGSQWSQTRRESCSLATRNCLARHAQDITARVSVSSVYHSIPKVLRFSSSHVCLRENPKYENSIAYQSNCQSSFVVRYGASAVGGTARGGVCGSAPAQPTTGSTTSVVYLKWLDIIICAFCAFSA